jgi:hypothetical protein
MVMAAVQAQMQLQRPITLMAFLDNLAVASRGAGLAKGRVDILRYQGLMPEAYGALYELLKQLKPDSFVHWCPGHENRLEWMAPVPHPYTTDEVRMLNRAADAAAGVSRDASWDRGSIARKCEEENDSWTDRALRRLYIGSLMLRTKAGCSAEGKPPAPLTEEERARIYCRPVCNSEDEDFAE